MGRTLLDVGAGVDAKNTAGYTALMRAAGRGHVNIVAALREADAGVNAFTNGSHTVLMLAAQGDHADAARARWSRRART